MRTLALLLAAGAVSLAGASTDVSSLFPSGITSAATVVQCQATGAVQYYAETRTSLSKIPTINTFKQDYLGDLPIDEKKQTIKDYDGEDITFDYKISYSIEYATTNGVTAISLTITFDNFYSWVKYNGLSLSRGNNLDESLFFLERNTKFNAYERFFSVTGNSKETAEIINAFNNHFDSAGVQKPGYLYILTNSARRTQTNADKVEKEYGSYTYYFKISEDLKSEVEILDRFPNTPIWYGIAVGATGIVMVVFYFIVKSRKTVSQS